MKNKVLIVAVHPDDERYVSIVGKEVILHNDKLVDSSKIKWARKMIRLYETYKSLGQNLFGK